MNLYQNLTHRGYKARELVRRVSPRNPNIYSSLEQVDVGSLTLQFKAVCNTEVNPNEEQLKASNSSIAMLVRNGEQDNKYGVDNIISSPEVVLVHRTPLTGGSQESLRLANEVFDILGSTKVASLDTLTAEQVSKLSAIGYTVAVDVSKL